MRERLPFDDDAFAELVIWRLPRQAPGSTHPYKYRLAFVIGDACVLRFDNEAGKGDHRHVRGRETPYRFVSLAKLRRDFESDIRKHGGEDEEDSNIGR